MPQPLRVLIVSHVPKQRELGAARVQIELAEELRRLGHLVERFDSVNAFGNTRPTRWRRALRLRFIDQAREYVREHGYRFDVIEALHGDLPFDKSELGFEGLLVSRSTGLYALYEEYMRYERSTWPSRIPGTVVGKVRNQFTVRQWSEACRRSLETADLIRVLNEDEEAYVRENLGFGDKCLTLPEAIADLFLEALARAALPAAARLQRREVVFIGSWSLRKGAADWAHIVTSTRALVPDARFLFLGTGCEPSYVLRDLGVSDVEWISVVPHFEPAELPRLLSSATVGALPSYVEGFGLGVLEQLAAGLPSIAYDVPGPRVMLRRLSKPLMVSRGDTSSFAGLLGKLLTQDRQSYVELSSECIGLAREFRWSKIARETADAYSAAADRVRASSPREGLDRRKAQSAARASNGTVLATRIGIVCGGSRNGVNAILDHSCRLSDALRDLGVAVELDVRASGTAGTEGVLSQSENASDSRVRHVVLLQYNPFLYGRWGFAPRLISRFVRLRLRRRRPRIALFIHEPFVPMVEWRSTLMGLWQRAQLLALRMTADVVFVSIQAWTESFRRSWPARLTLHVPVGSNLPDMRETREAARDRLGVAEDTLVIAKLGTSHPSHDAVPVTHSLDALSRSGHRVLLLVLGEGAIVPDRVPPGVEVHAPGGLPSAELARRLAAADLFLAPFVDGVSTRRGSLMAALQHGLAVVGTDGPLTDDVLRRQTAMRLAPVGRPELFAALVVRLADRPEERQAMGHAARLMYQELFDWPITARQLLHTLKAIA